MDNGTETYGDSTVSHDEDLKLVISRLNQAFVSLSGKLKKPNILLIGKTGAGKSSLVNAVFGEYFAKTGTGEPITKHLERFAPEDKPVVVFDTKGLEHGSHEEFLEETQKFLLHLRSSQDLTHHLHVIWYMIDMSHSRFQPFEEFICRELLSDISLIFILNKTDTCSENQIKSVTESIRKAKFPNCRGIYEVICDRQNYQVDECPICYSDDFLFRQKTKELICQNEHCMKRVTIGKIQGLENLIQGTTNQLPDFARYSFISAQEIDEKGRLRLAKEIICDCANTLRLRKSSGPRLAEMAVRLAMLWGYKFFPAIAGSEVSSHFKNIFSSKGFFERIALMLNDMLQHYTQSEALVISIGVELCRLLTELKMKAIGYVLQPNIELPQELDSLFMLNVNNSLLQQISQELQSPNAKLPDVVISFLRKRVAVCTKIEDWY